MPISAESNVSHPSAGPEYFESLAELDQWASAPRRRLEGVIPYHPRSEIAGAGHDGKGKLLVCHDYKGGYKESPSSLAYTFNFWDRCDTFIYFAHYCVTIPPPGWVTAAHRQGVKILGTLIFEDIGREDCLRLLVGRLPKSRTGPAVPSNNQALPLSSHYARVLADLAYERGFDGYLLNVECPLEGGPEQVRALDAWITLLDRELKLKVGAHAQTMWYDSVIITGQLRWQERLNSLNLPFFLSATSLFTNYFWPPHFPSLSAQYLLSLNPETTRAKPKSLQDIFAGVDVWGRGSHGNGGFGSYKAITHADPEFLGMSVAVFGPAWSWESEQDKKGWDWERWWAYERKLWVGPEREGEIVHVPEDPRPPQEGAPPCTHGDFQPIAQFFPRSPPPNPRDLAFFTTFCPGVGHAWFVEGRRVMRKESGWTDIDKQTSLGDLVWPRPVVSWEGDARDEPVPKASTFLDRSDAWNGGSSLRLTLSSPGSDSEDAVFQCLWVPIQSLALTSQISYDATVVYKVVAPSADVDLGLSVKVLSDCAGDVDINPGLDSDSGELPHGWNKVSIRFVCPLAQSPGDHLGSIGLIVGIAPESPSDPFEITLQIGQLSVHPSPPAGATPSHPRILWADFTPTAGAGGAASSAGALTWDTCASFASLPLIELVSVEDPTPAWNIDRSDGWFPAFAYFNVYAHAYKDKSALPRPEGASFVGTGGWDGVRNQLVLDKATLPVGLRNGEVRFYVQGVTDRGQVLPWDQCAFVDVA